MMGLLNIFLIISGSITKMSLKLISCIWLPNNKIVHLYDAQIMCFDGYWFFGFFCIILIIMAYIILFIMIYKQKNKKFNVENTFYKIISPYNESLWYWEGLLFLKRLMIAVLTSLQFMFKTNIDYILCSFIVIFGFFHSKINPFKYNRLNIFEIICLLSLSVVSISCATNVINVNSAHSKLQSIFVGSFILMPFIIFTILLIRMIIFIFISFKLPFKFTENDLKKIVKIKSRAPIVITSITHVKDKNNKNNTIDIDLDDEINIETKNVNKNIVEIKANNTLPANKVDIEMSQLDEVENSEKW
eukprot:465384_1